MDFLSKGSLCVHIGTTTYLPWRRPCGNLPWFCWSKIGLQYWNMYFFSPFEIHISLCSVGQNSFFCSTGNLQESMKRLCGLPNHTQHVNLWCVALFLHSFIKKKALICLLSTKHWACENDYRGSSCPLEAYSLERQTDNCNIMSQVLWLPRGGEIFTEKVTFVQDLVGFIGAQWAKRGNEHSWQRIQAQQEPKYMDVLIYDLVGERCGMGIQHRGLGRRRGWKAILWRAFRVT